MEVQYCNQNHLIYKQIKKQKHFIDLSASRILFKSIHVEHISFLILYNLKYSTYVLCRKTTLFRSEFIN